MLLLIASLLLLTYALWVASQFKKSSRSSPVPYIPSWIPFIGQGLNFTKDSTTFIKQIAQKHGPVFAFLLGGNDVTFVVDPQFFPTIRKAPQLSLHPVIPTIRRTLGVSKNGSKIPTTEIDRHITRTILSSEGIADLTSQNQIQLRRIFQQKYEVNPVQSGTLYKFVSEIIFETTAVAIFGEKFHDPKFLETFNAFDDAFPLLVSELPEIFFPRATSARAILKESLGKHAAGGWSGASKLMQDRSLLTKAMNLQESDLGSVELGVMWAALANTMPATYWVLYYLLTSEDALLQIKQEIQDNLPFQPLDKKDFVPWTVQQLDKCVKLQSSIYETLRLSAGSIVLRIAMEDVTLQFTDDLSVTLKKGQRLIGFPGYTHFDPTVFQDPFKFQFDRFLSGKLSPDTVIPFGMGASKCPGRHVAMNEIKMFVAILVQNLSFEVLPNSKIPAFKFSRIGFGVYPPTEDTVHFTSRLRTNQQK